MLVNGVLQYIYNRGANGTLIGDIANNGNGYADWLLTVDLSNLSRHHNPVPCHVEQRLGRWRDFFVTNPSRVPIPPALGLFGLGLAGIGLLKRVAKKRNANFALS